MQSTGVYGTYWDMQWARKFFVRILLMTDIWVVLFEKKTGQNKKKDILLY